ncbi:MAG: hypothetical protein GY793_11960 [Proteobacteria bacterium]|nr:hypothetical protein [Pseudomonadota bacterium]
MQNITSRSWLLPPQVKKESYLDVKSMSSTLFSFVNLKSAKKLIYIAPLMALLVGSCKTVESPLASLAFDVPQKINVALLPQKTIVAGNVQRPNRSNLYRAQNIVTKDPNKLKDLTLTEVSYIFGEPTFSRKDANARVWQYKTSSCVIDFYFYKDDKKSADSVSFVDMRFKEELIPGTSSRTAPASNQEQSGCLTDVVAARSYKKSKA